MKLQLLTQPELGKSKASLYRDVKKGDLISLNGHFIHNPFAHNIPVEDINDFLANNATVLALLMMRIRAGRTNILLKSHNKSDAASSVIYTSPRGDFNDSITQLGDIRDIFKPIAPAELVAQLHSCPVGIIRHYDLGNLDCTKNPLSQSLGFPLLEVNPEVALRMLLTSIPTNNLKDWVGYDILRQYFLDAYGLEGNVDDDDMLTQAVMQLTPKGKHDKSILVENIIALTNRPSYELFWKSRVAASIIKGNGHHWYIEKNTDWVLPYHVDNNHDMPVFLKNLLPEIDDVEANTVASQFEQELDLLADLSIRKPGSMLPPTLTELALSLHHSNIENVYSGKLREVGVLSGGQEESQELVGKTQGRVLSGCAAKIPTYLYADGEDIILEPSKRGVPFTHIFKFPNHKSVSKLVLCEWYGMEMTKAAGVPVPAFALVPNTKAVQHNVGDDESTDKGFDTIFDTILGGLSSIESVNTSPNYMIERFDITPPHAEHYSHGEELASIFGVSPDGKYNRLNYARIADHISSLSSNPKEDLNILYRQLLTNTLVANNDMHAKNLSMLRTYNKKSGELLSERLSPAYDVVTLSKELLPAISNANNAHALNLTTSNSFELDNLLTFAQSHLDMTLAEALATTKTVCKAIIDKALELQNNVPELIREHHPNCIKDFTVLRSTVNDQFETFVKPYLEANEITDFNEDNENHGLKHRF